MLPSVNNKTTTHAHNLYIQERYERQKKILEAAAASEPISEEGGPPRHTPRYVYRDPDRLVQPTTASKVMKKDWLG